MRKKSKWTFGENKPNRRPLAGNPKHEILNPKQFKRMTDERVQRVDDRRQLAQFG
jgi:hypothetical protein